ncbi:MAG: IPT/TIG domain-containing protein, partial [Bryobacterales bacterium]|nr:IPT/TIG domain-containing protein [Bryobacterales bacterium]
MAFRAPTPNTYLETAFFNPQEEDVQVDLDILVGQGWQPVETFTLAPREMRKLRVPATRLATARSSADRTALFRATYSVSVTELVANAWLEDETTGFSNTVLFHDVRPASNRLYGAQMVAYGYPRDLLPNGPTFDGHLVLANIGQEAQTITPTLHCDLGGKLSTQTLPPFALEPETIRTLSLNQILADQFTHAAEAICSAEIEFTGAPGALLGRYFGESSTFTYGLYSKLEAGLGHAYNELYWNVEGDREPLLTVTNFSDTPERIDIWATRDAGSKILRTVELPAKASVHINMQQDFTQRAAELQPLRDRAYGGFFIRAESPKAKILVKEHIFSQSRQVASPYYGGVDVLISHHIRIYFSHMLAGQTDGAQTETCYNSGCYWNNWQLSSHHPHIISAQWAFGYGLRPITAHQPGNGTLHSSATGPINAQSEQGWKADAVTISVYDATPVINAIVPNAIPAGQTSVVEIWGLNFGVNPLIQAAAGITVGNIQYSGQNQINVVLTHNPGFPPGEYNIWVTSRGFSGNGYQSAPGGGSQAQSGPRTVTVDCGATPTVTITSRPLTLTAISGTTHFQATLSASATPAGGVFLLSTDSGMVTFPGCTAGQSVPLRVINYGTETLRVQYTGPCGQQVTDELKLVVTDEISVMGWVNPQYVQNSDVAGINFATVSQNIKNVLRTDLTGDMPGCIDTLLSWVDAGAAGNPALAFPPVDTDNDRRYVNWWVNLRSANSTPPSSVTSSSFQNQTDQFRLFNSFRAKFEVTNNRITNHQTLVAIARGDGKTLEPCSGLRLAFASPPGEPHAGFNGFIGVTSDGQRVYHVTESRIGQDGQKANRYLNKRTYPNVTSATPYVWIAIQFNLSGQLQPIAAGGTSDTASPFPS